MQKREAAIREQLMREDLPYGERVFVDGCTELFNRKYETIARRGERTTDKIVSEKWFYDDSNPPWVDDETRKRCLDVWRRWPR